MTDLNRLHVPAVTERGDGGWAVYCVACSDAAQEWVNPCTAKPEDAPWPPAVLVERWSPR